MTQMVSPIFSKGWNAAASGKLMHENPYPEIHADDPNAMLWAMAGLFSRHIPGASNWDLWMAGYVAYMESEYHCIASQRYELFKAEKENRAVFEAGARTLGNEFYYPDGSAVKIDELRVYVFSKLGRQFIQYGLTQTAILLATVGSDTDGVPAVQSA